MDEMKEKPQGAINAQGACKSLHADSAAHQDFTPRAIDSSLLLALLKITTARQCLRVGDLEATMAASLEADRSLGAAIDSLHVHVG